MSVFNCAVCGKPVDPTVDICMTAGSKPLFVVHDGECRNTIRNGATVLRDVVESRWPLLQSLRKTAVAFAEAMKK